MSVEIRPLFAPDLKLGYVETLSALSPVTLPHEELVKVFQERLGTWKTFVALIDGKVVGTASVHFERKFYRDGKYVAHIEDVAVHPDHQRKGIGGLLMQKLEQLGREKGCYKAVLDCSEQNVPFYEKLGYRRHEQQMRKDL